ncbi:MAG: hypothetical protein V4760_11595 [Bdellovibrionota bacterium]
MISLKAHNIIDYVLGVLLMVAPWVYGFAEIPAARTLFLFAGVALVAYSLFTNYYYSLAKVIPLGVHMTLDATIGVVTILAPALFGYRELLTEGQYALHVIAGVGAVGLVALTKPRTETAKTPAERAALTS